MLPRGGRQPDQRTASCWTASSGLLSRSCSYRLPAPRRTTKPSHGTGGSASQAFVSDPEETSTDSAGCFRLVRSVAQRDDRWSRPSRQSRRSGWFGRGGVLRSRPLVTGDSVAASHCAQPLPICSAGRIAARSRRGVAAGLVTLALAARDQRLRNRRAAALS